MAILNPLFYYANQRGIPRLEASGVTIGTNEVTYNFSPNLFRVIPFSGLILFKLPEYTAPATAVPVVFGNGSRSVNVTTTNGTNVTSAELNQSGIYLAYYENNTLQLLTGI